MFLINVFIPEVLPVMNGSQKSGKIRFLLALILLLLLAVVLITAGPAPISFRETLTILCGGVMQKSGQILAGIPGAEILREHGQTLLGQSPANHEAIILNVRLPRVILGILVGMSLAVAGGCFQALLRNPMADPYVIGVSSGASFGAALAIVLNLQLMFLGANWAVTIFAFCGALAAIVAVYRIAAVNGHIPVATLLLAGIAVAAFLSSCVSFLMVMGGKDLHGIVFWIMGSLASYNWSYIKVLLPLVIAGGGIIFWHARSLNVMVLGEETAKCLGLDVDRVKKILFASCSLVVAAAVSVSGVIGFVGLIIPHVVRLCVGPDHRVLLPASALSGALFLVLCDTLARTVLAPVEIPVGMVTSLMGAPFFIFLLVRRKNQLF